MYIHSQDIITAKPHHIKKEHPSGGAPSVIIRPVKNIGFEADVIYDLTELTKSDHPQKINRRSH
jgi:hypothetical protein